MIRLKRFASYSRVLSLLVYIFFIAGSAWSEERLRPDPVPELRPGLISGYLPLQGTSYGVAPAEGLPDSFKLIPPPPVPGSALHALDVEYSKRCIALRDSTRWNLAVSDDNLSFPEAAGIFDCALNLPISDEETPFLYQILRRTIVDAGLATYPAKFAYKVHRPFMVNQEPLCVPDQKEYLEKNWSYPSGHTATGWAWALILTEIVPERANEILARGLAFGESRAICNVHWYSDIMWGRVVAASVVARLHADPVFRHDMEQAKAEIAAVREKGLKPTNDCDAEAMALSIKP